MLVVYVVVTSGLKEYAYGKSLHAVLGRWRPCDEKLNLFISVSVLKYYVS